MNIILKTLALVLTLSILATGAFAVSLTHVYVAVSFGQAPQQTASLAQAIDVAQLEPLPLHKPDFKGAR